MKLSPERKAKLSQIRKEVEVTNFQFGAHRYDKLTTDPKFPETAKLLVAAYDDMAVAVFVFKQRYNRVRPSLLEVNERERLGYAR